MSKGRLEAFSDGVFAVIITIMVLDMKVPTGATFAALKSVLPVFLSYPAWVNGLGLATGVSIEFCQRCSPYTRP